MSFILDALKKSESERQERSDTDFATVPSSPDTPAAPRWLWILGALLAINVIVVAGLLLRPDTTSTSIPSASTVDPPTPVAASDTVSFSNQVAGARRTEPAAALSEPVPVVQRTNVTTSQTRRPPVSVANLPVTRAAILPTLTELRANGTLQLLDLHVDIHVYSDVPSERFVFINMNKYQENSRLDEGPEIDEITRDGVILEYRGTTFLLPRE
jgi:general secretion pathway protein B